MYPHPKLNYYTNLGQININMTVVFWVSNKYCTLKRKTSGIVFKDKFNESKTSGIRLCESLSIVLRILKMVCIVSAEAHKNLSYVRWLICCLDLLECVLYESLSILLQAISWAQTYLSAYMWKLEHSISYYSTWHGFWSEMYGGVQD